MDTSITFVTPEYWRKCGAADYDRGLGVNEHGMNPGSRAIADWQFGWHTRRIERAQARSRAQMAVAA